MTTEQKVEGAQDTLVDDLTEQLDGLEGLVNGVRDADVQKLASAKTRLVPCIERAAVLKTQYAELQERFAPVLARMEAIDMNLVRTFPGWNNLGNIKEDAQRLREAFTAAIAELTQQIARVDKLRFKDVIEGMAQQIQETVGTHVGGPERLTEKVKQLLARMQAFDHARRA
jgi:23S rRNA pseudoU1915 N3-methylase RlmH